MSIDPNTFPILEQASGVYRASITDEAGALLPGSTLATLTLTLYVIGAGGTITYINSRDHQDVFNTNGVQVFDALQTDTFLDGSTVTYNLKWIVAPEDTTLVSDQLKVERHIALFEWTWGVGKKGKHEVVLGVKNLNEVA